MTVTREQIKSYMRGMFNWDPAWYQLEFAHDCINSKRVIGVFCRQSGKTTVTSKIAIMLARIPKNGHVMVIAPTDRQTGIMASKIKESLLQMPNLEDFKLLRYTQRVFYFSNGREIHCETSGDDGRTIRGYTAGDIIIEEASYVKDSIVQTVILPMGATTDPTIILIGTPFGRNHFYESYAGGRYKVHQYGWKIGVDAGVVKLDYVDEMKEKLSDLQFRTEMNAEFVADQDNYFGYELIQSCVDESLSWDGKAKVDGCTYYLGADIARLGQDSTCLTVVEMDREGFFKVVQIVEIQKTTLDVIMNRIHGLHQVYDFKRMFLDETGLGAGVTDVLAKNYNAARLLEGQRIANFKREIRYADKVVGVRFTIQSKLDMYSNLQVVMTRGKLKFPKHPKLIAQLRDFRYEHTESGNVKLHSSEYGHDDFCDSLALAVKEANQKRPVLII